MWRFLVVSFVVLGWSFYELSGGSDYAPAEHSLQVQGLPSRATPEPARVAAPEQQRTIADVEATMQRLGETEEKTDAVTLTLAQVNRDAFSIIEAEAERPKAELLALELPEQMVALPEPEFELGSGPVSDPGIDAAIAAALGEVIAAPEDLRWVKENVVDLRSGPGLTFDTVVQLTRGAEVAILEDPGNGWLNVQVVDGYTSGWVAEWLLMMPEN